MFTAPQKLLVVSDNNEMEFTHGAVSAKPKDSEIKFGYTYTKSESKLGTKVSFTEKELKYYLENIIFIAT